MLIDWCKERKRKRFWETYRKERAKMQHIVYERRWKYLRDNENYLVERFRKFDMRLKTALIIPYLVVFVISFMDVFNDYRLSALIFASYGVFAATVYIAFSLYLNKPSRRKYKELRMVQRWAEKQQ